jgi:glycosyltransferase involved in cell wall biosynthesis
MELEYLSNHNDAPFLHKIKTWLGLPRLRSLERKELDISSALHVLSHFTRGELTKLHARLPETKVIPHWRQPERKRTVSKEEARDKLGWRTDIPIFFTLRHHGPRNGIDTAIRAVAPLANRDQCQFMIGGKGALLAYHQKLAASLHPGTNIQLLGRMSEEDLILAYQAADAFLLPTRALECFGLIILEAYSYGCPVIGTNVGAIPELLQPISPQLLCPPDDVAHWQWKLERFLDGSLTTPTPEALIEYVDTHFGKQEVTKSILRWLGGTQLHQLWKPTQGLKIKGVLS